MKKYENDLNFEQIEFPVRVKDIRKFEKQNSNLLGINLFSLNENNKVYPLRIFQKECQKDCQKITDLFLYSKDGKQHYSLIKNFSRLIRSQLTKDTTNKFSFAKGVLFIIPKKNSLKNT